MGNNTSKAIQHAAQAKAAAAAAKAQQAAAEASARAAAAAVTAAANAQAGAEAAASASRQRLRGQLGAPRQPQLPPTSGGSAASAATTVTRGHVEGGLPAGPTPSLPDLHGAFTPVVAPPPGADDGAAPPPPVTFVQSASHLAQEAAARPLSYEQLVSRADTHRPGLFRRLDDEDPFAEAEDEGAPLFNPKDVQHSDETVAAVAQEAAAELGASGGASGGGGGAVSVQRIIPSYPLHQEEGEGEEGEDAEGAGVAASRASSLKRHHLHEKSPVTVGNVTSLDGSVESAPLNDAGTRALEVYKAMQMVSGGHRIMMHAMRERGGEPSRACFAPAHVPPLHWQWRLHTGIRLLQNPAILDSGVAIASSRALFIAATMAAGRVPLEALPPGSSYDGEAGVQLLPPPEPTPFQQRVQVLLEAGGASSSSTSSALAGGSGEAATGCAAGSASAEAEAAATEAAEAALAGFDMTPSALAAAEAADALIPYNTTIDQLLLAREPPKGVVSGRGGRDGALASGHRGHGWGI